MVYTTHKNGKCGIVDPIALPTLTGRFIALGFPQKKTVLHSHPKRNGIDSLKPYPSGWPIIEMNRTNNGGTPLESQKTIRLMVSSFKFKTTLKWGL